MLRDLDGYYFRAQRDGKWCSICFTDLTESEAIEKIKDRPEEWLKSLYDGLCDVANSIYNELLPREVEVIEPLLKVTFAEDSLSTKVMKVRYNIITIAEEIGIVGVSYGE